MIVIILHGIAGSGKSTLAERLKKIFQSKFKRTKIISKDDFRYYNGKYIFDLENEKMVESRFIRKFIDTLDSEYEFIILDNTHLNPRFRYTIECICESYEVPFKYLSILPKDIDFHVKNNIHEVEKDSIERQIIDFKEPLGLSITVDELRTQEAIEKLAEQFSCLEFVDVNDVE